MKRSPSQTVRCISCELSCQLFPDTAVRASYCHRAAFAIWPEGNGFLQKELLKSFCLIIKTICRVGLFLWTFSFPNLRLFADPQWVDRFAYSGMHIVLIADRNLGAVSQLLAVQKQ